MYLTQEFRRTLAALHGRRAFLHVDLRGAITVGVGHVVPDALAAQALPFLSAATGERATAEEIAAAWGRLDALRLEGKVGREFLPEFYREVSGLSLSDEAVDELLTADIAAAEARLGALLPRFPRCPLPAQEVLVELALGRGAEALAEERHGPLLAAYAAGDYKAAAALLSAEAGPRPGKLDEERAAWRGARLERAARDRAIELSVEQKLESLLQSLGTMTETAKGELKKMEDQVGELAAGLLGKAQTFLKDLATQAQAQAQVFDEARRKAEAEERANRAARATQGDAAAQAEGGDGGAGPGAESAAAPAPTPASSPPAPSAPPAEGR